MGFWDTVGVGAILLVLVLMLVFPRRRRAAPKGLGHALIVTIPLSEAGFGTPEEREKLRRLRDELDQAIRSGKVGECGGDEFGEGFCKLFMYGPDAGALFEAAAPMLRAAGLRTGVRVLKRWGPADDPAARAEVTDL